jgi:MauM/NapG family ferredoxin protein
MNKREFLKTFMAASLPALSLFAGGYHSVKNILPKRKNLPLRPPGSLNEEEFLATCIRCRRCGQVCPNETIKYYDNFNPAITGTPYINPREKGCILCMKCNNTCPSGALVAIPDDSEEILKSVRMGKAVVDKNICNSFNGYVCGVCVFACPYDGIAIYSETWEQPVVTDKCVGCGLCEQVCIHYPQAIRVIPGKTGNQDEKV